MKRMTNKTIKEIKQFNNKIESYEDRKAHVEDVFSKSATIHDYIGKTMLDCNRPISQQGVVKAIEDQGTYLLNSKDVTSGREQEYSYYRDERDYRSNYAAGARTVSTDIESREDLHEETMIENYSIMNIDYLQKLFNFDNMTTSEWGRMLKFGLREKSNPENDLSNYMHQIYEWIMDSLDDEGDRKIIDMLSDGHGQEDISNELNKSQSTINYRINNVIRKKLLNN